ncbi:MAG: peptidase M15 [Desulfovibrionaceae bacterium]|jgi:uncharacterized protein YcbK (DUF882 family)|nr:peptidase M15 [Desulfovibrionaceae bacterium]
MPTFRHFHTDEFACPCCGANHIQPEFVARLDQARSLAATPFRITSGFRCAAHNAAVGGVAGSAHLAGRAADIACASPAERLRIVAGLLGAGFTRIGAGADFVHADDDPSKPAPALWLYN